MSKLNEQLPILRKLLPSKQNTEKENIKTLPSLTEEQKQQILINNLSRALTITSKQRPLAIIIEDAHWMDIRSQELINDIIQRLNTQSIYFLLVYRPQLKPKWAYATNHTQLWLSPLSEQHLEKILNKQLKPGELAPEERKWIYQQTGGNPFFAKELVRELIDSELLVRKTRWWKFNTSPKSLTVGKEPEQVLWRRIGRIPEKNQPLLRYAATLVSPFSETQAQFITDSFNMRQCLLSTKRTWWYYLAFSI